MKKNLFFVIQVLMVMAGAFLVLIAPYSIKGLIYWVPGVLLFLLGLIPILKNKSLRNTNSDQ
jgi:putative Mn2+ efflux pump MntP